MYFLQLFEVFFLFCRAFAHTRQTAWLVLSFILSKHDFRGAALIPEGLSEMKSTVILASNQATPNGFSFKIRLAKNKITVMNVQIFGDVTQQAAGRTATVLCKTWQLPKEKCLLCYCHFCAHIHTDLSHCLCTCWLCSSVKQLCGSFVPEQITWVERTSGPH